MRNRVHLEVQVPVKEKVPVHLEMQEQNPTAEEEVMLHSISATLEEHTANKIMARRLTKAIHETTGGIISKRLGIQPKVVEEVVVAMVTSRGKKLRKGARKLLEELGTEVPRTEVQRAKKSVT